MQRITAAILASLACGPALANDGIAGVSAGGIVFRKTDAIAMKKEVLNVSHDLITVDYEFVNESPADVEETIVFPLPAYTAAQQPSDTYYGQPNGFIIRVDGKPVGFTSRLTALHEGRDVTAQLRQLGLSDAQIADSPTFARAPRGAAVPDMTAQQRQQLEKLGLLTDYYGGDELQPAWQVQVNYVWRQKFPAGKVVRVHHAYRPFVSAGPGESTMDEDFSRRYCADQAFMQAWRKIAARNQAGMVNARHVSYILKTGNTWKRGIEDFTLNIIKRKPSELVSLCFPGTVKKIDAHTFQVRLSNFQPADDLNVYFGNVGYDFGDNSGVRPIVGARAPSSDK
jgi:hypothetical protein